MSHIVVNSEVASRVEGLLGGICNLADQADRKLSVEILGKKTSPQTIASFCALVDKIFEDAKRLQKEAGRLNPDRAGTSQTTLPRFYKSEHR